MGCGNFSECGLGSGIEVIFSTLFPLLMLGERSGVRVRGREGLKVSSDSEKRGWGLFKRDTVESAESNLEFEGGTLASKEFMEDLSLGCAFLARDRVEEIFDPVALGGTVASKVFI